MGIIERKEREKEQRRNDIVDAAEQVFFTKGYENATMDDVAEKAELSKGTLYLYFRNKEDLHYAIILRGLEKVNSLIREEYSEKLKGADNLLEMGRGYVRFTKEQPNYFNAIMHFDSAKIEKVDPDKKARLFQDDSPLVFLIEVVLKGQQDGSIRTDIEAKELAIILWSQLSGVLEFIVLRSQLVEMLEIVPEEMIMNQFKILLEGLRTK
ncbi:MAG: TetR/AcrR family transcriptional regulator [Bacteroidota bacterium]